MARDHAVAFLISLKQPSTPTVYDPDCYICNDPDYAKAGLPLCRACPVCGGHIAADESECQHCQDKADNLCHTGTDPDMDFEY